MVDYCKGRGTLIACVKAIFIALTGLFAKLAHQAGFSVFQTLAAQTIVAIIILLPWYFRFKNTPKLSGYEWRLITLRALFSVATTGAFFYSLEGISLMTALLLFNSGPLFVPFVARIWGGEPLSLERILYIALGFLGICLILDPENQNETYYTWFAFASGVASSLVTVSTGKVVTNNRLELSTFVALMLNAIVFSCLSLTTWSWEFSNSHLIYLLLAGCCWVVVQVSFKALRFIRPVILAPLLFLSVVVSGILDWLVWGHFVDNETVTGICLVIIGSILVLSVD